MKTIKIFHALPLLPIAFMAPAVAADDVIQLNPVVVTATSLEQNIVDAPSAMSIITRKELDNRPVHDLVDALQGTESIQFTGEGMTRRGISIRGMPTSHTLILLDGKRISSAGAIAHSDYDYNWMPVEAIERIEVVRGPISSLYGSDALGGVVNVIPRKPTDEWKGSLRLGGGLMDHNRGGGSHQEGIYLGGPVIKDKLGISFTGTNQRREATKDPADPTISELEGRESHQGDMTVVFTPFDNHRFDIGYGSGREKRWRDTKTSGSSPKNYQSNETIEREQQSFKYEGDWDWGNTIIRTYRNRLDRNVRYTNNQKPSDPNTTIKNSIVDFHANLTAIDKHTVTFGGEWHEEELESQGFANDGASAIYRSFFIQEQYAITPDLSLLVGNRLDRHENYGNHHSPRGYLVYSLTDKLTIKGGAGRGFKAPTLKQLSPSYSATGGGGRFTIYGNPDLNPEINTSYELNIDYTENNWSAHIGLFKNNVRDLIQTRCISNCGIRPLEVRTYTNVDKADIRGIELGFRSALIDHLVWSANYTYLDARDATSDERLLDRSRHLANTTLEWKATDRLSLQLRGQYTGSQLGTDRVPLPAYSIWGLETSYRIYKDVALHFAIENIADKRPSDDNGNFSYTEPGRSFNLLLTAGF